MPGSDLREDNLTGGQIQDALDFLIYSALEPIVLYSNVFDVQLVHLLGIAASNKKRKLSALPREVFVSRICAALFSKDPKEKFELISGAKIERGFVYNFIVKFFDETAVYPELYTKYLCCAQHVDRSRLDMRMAAIERSLGFSRERLFAAINIATSYLELAYIFRNKIVMNYLKHAYKQARAFCKVKGKNFNYRDVRQNLLVAVTKAVDKYDSSKGALTSYINYWILNALTYANPNHGHEYGVAYTIPQGLKKTMASGRTKQEVNFSVSLDSLASDEEGCNLLDRLVGDVGVDVELENRSEAAAVLALIKRADTKGIARLYLDIDETMFNSEKRRMVDTMRDQLGIVPNIDISEFQKGSKIHEA